MAASRGQENEEPCSDSDSIFPSQFDCGSTEIPFSKRRKHVEVEKVCFPVDVGHDFCMSERIDVLNMSLDHKKETEWWVWRHIQERNVYFRSFRRHQSRRMGLWSLYLPLDGMDHIFRLLFSSLAHEQSLGPCISIISHSHSPSFTTFWIRIFLTNEPRSKKEIQKSGISFARSARLKAGTSMHFCEMSILKPGLSKYIRREDVYLKRSVIIHPHFDFEFERIITFFPCPLFQYIQDRSGNV
jgi:hypothetical protein